MKTDTIAAIATALSPSGIGIIRISGDEAIEVADKIYRSRNGKKLSESDTHSIHYGHIFDGEDMIDEVMVLLMRAPHSFTRENTVEIDCHGGVYVMNRILQTVIKYGARMAEPGEFTKRAFLNGRIDLTKAEAIMDLIQSKNEMARKNSLTHLKGDMYKKIKALREEILYEIAFIESALDDPEHISLEGFHERLEEKSDRIIADLKHLISTAENGRIIREGINTVIVGKPNVGKSSFLNLLLGEERAIVTDIAGTTRDTLEESVSLDGLTLNLIDTAGIHETKDIVEQIGVEKAKKSLADADFIIYMIDSSVPMDESDYEIIALLDPSKTVVLLNKSDLEQAVTKEMAEKSFKEGNVPDVLSISAGNKEGLDDFIILVKEKFMAGTITFDEELMVANIRQKNALVQALANMEMVKKSLEDDMPEDFYSIDLMSAYATLGELIGEEVGEDLVNEIFSKFCMGK